MSLFTHQMFFGILRDPVSPATCYYKKHRSAEFPIQEFLISIRLKN